MTTNRMVALLTPILAPLVGLVSKLIAEKAPGINIPKEDLNGIFIGGTLVVLAPALQWLHGWQKHEAREAEIQRAVEVARASSIPVTATSGTAEFPEGDEYAGDFNDYDFEEYGADDEPYVAGDYDDYEYDPEFDDDFGDELDDEPVIELDEPAAAGS